MATNPIPSRPPNHPHAHVDLREGVYASVDCQALFGPVMSYQASSYQPSSRPQLAQLDIQPHQQPFTTNNPTSPFSFNTPMGKSSSTGPAGYSSINRPRPNLGIVTGASEGFPQRAARKSSLPQLPLTSPFLVPEHSLTAQMGSPTGALVSPGQAGLGRVSPSGSDGNLLSPPLTPSSQAKKANPLIDLIETETAYVADLGSIIKVSNNNPATPAPRTRDARRPWRAWLAGY